MIILEKNNIHPHGSLGPAWLLPLPGELDFNLEVLRVQKSGPDSLITPVGSYAKPPQVNTDLPYQEYEVSSFLM